MTSKFTFERTSDVEIDDVLYTVDWVNKVTVDRYLYGADADGNRGEMRTEIGESYVDDISFINPKPPTKDIRERIEKEIEKETQNNSETWDLVEKESDR